MVRGTRELTVQDAVRAADAETERAVRERFMASRPNDVPRTPNRTQYLRRLIHRRAMMASWCMAEFGALDRRRIRLLDRNGTLSLRPGVPYRQSGVQPAEVTLRVPWADTGRLGYAH